MTKLSKDTETHKCSLGIEICIKLVEEKLKANSSRYERSEMPKLR